MTSHSETDRERARALAEMPLIEGFTFLSDCRVVDAGLSVADVDEHMRTIGWRRDDARRGWAAPKESEQ